MRGVDDAQLLRNTTTIWDVELDKKGGTLGDCTVCKRLCELTHRGFVN